MISQTNMQQATKCIDAASCSLTLSAAAVSPCFHDNDQLETGLQIFLFAMTPICFAHQHCPPAAKNVNSCLANKNPVTIFYTHYAVSE